ncbi:MAG: N-formylglutamate amidohydrolase [Proteobacteria bacterium]|nr:N-formylglutamate amidohydrolase [Pseudomonadota bacterium]
MAKLAAKKSWTVLISCEHASWNIPKAFKSELSRLDDTDLKTHRGWDCGALTIAKYLARTLKVSCFASNYSRLLVDCNRSPHHRECLGGSFRDLELAKKNFILALFYWPHRNAVEAEIRRLIADGHRVLHIAVHSFTPKLKGVVRNADIAFLYDPSRPQEKLWSNRILTELAGMDSLLKLRRNYPYRGVADGFTTWLRKYNKAQEYAGLELEINQKLLSNIQTAAQTRRQLAQAIQKALKLHG